MDRLPKEMNQAPIFHYSNLNLLNSSYSPSSPLNLEGELDIKIGGQVFFHESAMPLIEFAARLSLWIEDVATNEHSVMEYTSLEADDVLMLKFEECSNNLWKIYSDWQEFECECLIPKSLLVESVLQFINQLLSDIKFRFNITI